MELRVYVDEFNRNVSNQPLPVTLSTSAPSRSMLPVDPKWVASAVVKGLNLFIPPPAPSSSTHLSSAPSSPDNFKEINSD